MLIKTPWNCGAESVCSSFLSRQNRYIYIFFYREGNSIPYIYVHAWDGTHMQQSKTTLPLHNISIKNKMNGNKWFYFLARNDWIETVSLNLETIRRFFIFCIFFFLINKRNIYIWSVIETKRILLYSADWSFNNIKYRWKLF